MSVMLWCVYRVRPTLTLIHPQAHAATLHPSASASTRVFILSPTPPSANAVRAYPPSPSASSVFIPGSSPEHGSSQLSCSRHPGTLPQHIKGAVKVRLPRPLDDHLQDTSQGVLIKYIHSERLTTIHSSYSLHSNVPKWPPQKKRLLIFINPVCGGTSIYKSRLLKPTCFNWAHSRVTWQSNGAWLPRAGILIAESALRMAVWRLMR